MAQHVHAHSEEQDFFAACYRWIRAAVQEQCRCRECGEHCELTASVCETCGTQDPVRLPISWGLAAIGTVGLICALGVWLF